MPLWWGGSVAAALALGLVLGHLLPEGDAIVNDGNRMVAASELRQALDRQLASETGPTQVLASFRGKTGAYHFRPFGRPQIEAYFGGACADELEAAGKGAFFDFARSELVALLGADFARRIKPLYHHGWRGDPFARGSYSYAFPDSAGCRAALAAPVDNRLFFAGEACSPQFYSTAHGAWLTGVAAAEQALAALR